MSDTLESGSALCERIELDCFVWVFVCFGVSADAGSVSCAGSRGPGEDSVGAGPLRTGSPAILLGLDAGWSTPGSALFIYLYYATNS